MPTSIDGKKLINQEALDAIKKFRGYIPQLIYKESITYSIKVLEEYLKSAKKELKSLDPTFKGVHCISILPIVETDESTREPFLSVLLTPSLCNTLPNNYKEIYHQYTTQLHPRLKRKDNPYGTYSSDFEEGFNHGQGAPFVGNKGK
jgi:hypothetical protein